MSGAKENYETWLAQAARRLSREIDISFDSNPFRPLKRRFAVATSFRTGSYLLCERLLNHGAVMTECFLPSRIQNICRIRRRPSLQDYCDRHLRDNAVGGIFGVKGGIEILVPLALAWEFPDYLDSWKFVHLTRTDKVKQAISHVIAHHTQAWRSFKEPVKVLTDDDFDASKIDVAMRSLAEIHRLWEETFSLFGIDPLRITYEELAADPDGVSAQVAAYAGLDGPPITSPRFVTPPMERQADALNARWEDRFVNGGGLERVANSLEHLNAENGPDVWAT